MIEGSGVAANKGDGEEARLNQHDLRDEFHSTRRMDVSITVVLKHIFSNKEYIGQIERIDSDLTEKVNSVQQRDFKDWSG